MRVLKIFITCIAYIVLWFILSAIFTLILPNLTINKNPNRSDFLIAQKIDNDISLTSLNEYSINNNWFDKDESRDFPEYGGIYVKVLEKSPTSERLEVTYISDDYDRIYTYEIKNNKIIMESSYYRGIGTMLPSMILSVLTILLVYFLYPVIKKRLTFNRIVR